MPKTLDPKSKRIAAIKRKIEKLKAELLSIIPCAYTGVPRHAESKNDNVFT